MSRIRTAATRAGVLFSALGPSLLAGVATPARAGFDPATGRVVLEGAALALPFDSAEELPPPGLIAYLDGELSGVRPSEEDFQAGEDAVIEGTAALRLSPRVTGLVFTLDGVAEALRGRRLEVRAWYRPEGSYPVVDVIYLERGGADALTSGDWFDESLGQVRLLPTGRATDDGWVELSSGPFDFSLTGAIEARIIRIFDARIWELTFQRATTLQGSTLLDGLEIVDLGPARFSGGACRRATEPEACPGGACFLGACVDPKPLLGNLPEGDAILSEYLERQISRFEAFAGGRVPQSNLELFAERIRSLPSLRDDLVAFWSTYRRAHDDVADGHLSEPRHRFFTPVAAGACVHLGEVDLLPGGSRPGYLVYSADPSHGMGRLLSPGDVLESIDGLSPEAWAERSDRDLRYGGDPRGRAFVVAPQILSAAIGAGSLLRFARCRSTDGTPCEERQTQRFEIDLATLTRPLQEGRRPSWWLGGLDCDFRFRPSVSGGGRNRVVFRDEEGVRTLSIDGVVGLGSWAREATAATTDLPARVVLDQRTGTGGTFEGVIALTAPFLAASERPIAQIFPWLVPELTASSRAQFAACFAAGSNLCGNAFEEPLHGAPPSRVPEARLAILNGRDVSGNDYLARVLRDRQGGTTRIFGGAPTFGAFGPVITLPRILDELVGGAVQLQDTVFVRDASDDNLRFNTGIGVAPDEVVLQRQSDAVAGRDTLLEAARAWVRGESP